MNGAEDRLRRSVPPDDDDDALQEYIVLVLADSNLPTGGFVASSGLESYWAHGLMRGLGHSAYGGGGHNPSTQQLVTFIAASLDTYAHTVAAFLLDTHRITRAYMHANDSADDTRTTADVIVKLDNSLHAMMLNHVAQRASQAQGVALLTLYAKSFAPVDSTVDTHERRSSLLMQELKLRIRRDECRGHLSVCWAAFMAALGIRSGRRALAVHLFLQARAILSSAVRLNVVGPYMMHRMLAYDVKALIDRAVERVAQHSTLTLAADGSGVTSAHDANTNAIGAFEWTWPEVGPWEQASHCAPKTTWPLGDVLQARHDQLHSRLFNS